MPWMFNNHELWILIKCNFEEKLGNNWDQNQIHLNGIILSTTDESKKVKKVY